MPKFTLTQAVPKIKPIFLAVVLLSSLTPLGTRVAAEAVISCDLAIKEQEFSNAAIADYQRQNITAQVISNRQSVNGGEISQQAVRIINRGVEDEAGNVVGVLGAIASNLDKNMTTEQSQADVAVITALSQWAQLPANTSSLKVVTTIQESLAEQSEKVEQTQMNDEKLLTILAGLDQSNLTALGLSATEIKSAIEISSQEQGSFREQISGAYQALSANVTDPDTKARLLNFQQGIEAELTNIRQQQNAPIALGSILNFKFSLENNSTNVARVELPRIQAVRDTGFLGQGELTQFTYTIPGSEPEIITDTAQSVTIAARKSVDLNFRVKVGKQSDSGINQLAIELESNCGNDNLLQQLSIFTPIEIDNDDDDELIDPRGRISGCAGELLPEYQGFSVGLYDVDPSDPTQSEVSSLTPLTNTELPDDPDNNIAPGIEPNIENSNPFFLSNEDEGQYSFLFDEARGQLDPGRSYILVVDPGANSVYAQRQVKLTIGNRLERVVEYTATSLDGRPISAEDGSTTVTGEILLIEDAERVGLNLAVLDLSTDICDAQEIVLTKTGDRATAEPGDIVLYRLAVQNLATSPLSNFQITDTLPPGFTLDSQTVIAEVESQRVEIEISSQSDRTVNFIANTTLQQDQSLNLIYAAQISPDALRGSAENSAIVNALRADNNQEVKDGPAIYSVDLESGILSDSGTLIGRVFVDKNFDGEQQEGEPGIPNATIYLNNGNRIITDPDGLFSLSNVLPGYHTGVLDLTTIPEYGLAPNIRFSERNSTSRLVQLEPGGLVRMNFGVTPTANDQSDRPKPNKPNKTKSQQSKITSPQGNE
ncbi:MAG: hypothetical protein AAFO95_06910 [Cyanobacteria bacterium J06600_6]